jgi:hypothetical protein
MHVDFGDDVVDQAAVELDARCDFFIDEVERHLDVQFVGRINALEVDVQNERLVGVRLEIAQQNLFLLAVEDEMQNGRMEGFLLQLQQQVVVVEFDSLGSGFAAINDARDGAGTTQAAARTRSLQRTRLRDQFKSHGDTPIDFPNRDQSGRV